MKREMVEKKTYVKILLTSLVFIAMAALLVLPVNAALQSVGPTDPANGFSIYYKDANNLSLIPCIAGSNGLADPLCVLPLTSETFGGIVTYNPALPIVFPTNFPSEDFYWIANSRTLNGGLGGKARFNFRMALEGAFATLNPVGMPAAGEQITFLRINLQKTVDLTPNSRYNVTYPFGNFSFFTDSKGATITQLAGQAFRTEDSSFIPGDFASLLPAPTTNIGPFLIWNQSTGQAAPPAGYIGNPGVAHLITSGPNGNFLQIDGPGVGGKYPNGSLVNTIKVDQWTIAGKIMTPGVTMVVDVPAKTTGVNTFATYQLTVTNTGNSPERFDLAVLDTPGAIAVLNKSSITLASGASGAVMLSVMSAELGSYVVNVTAASSANASVNATITTNTTVTGISPSIAMLGPGGSVQFSSSDPNVNWFSSNTTVGGIDADGNFTALVSGNTTITAINTTDLTLIGTSIVIVGTPITAQPLVAGYNLILVPVQTDPAFTASKLLQLVPAQNPGVTGLKVVRWDPTAQMFVTYDPVIGLNDFSIEAMKAYFVKVSKAVNGITIVGP
ncbi:MAG: hypothetical protein WA130_02700 [Candidatus Methanoperedens sp.]